MFQHVHGAIDARTLAVPDGEDTVILRGGIEVGLLRAPDGGRGQILVQTGLEPDVVLLQVLLGLPELLVIGAERGTAITGDETGRVQPRGDVPVTLHHRQADQGLRAGDEHAAFFQFVLVVQRYLGEVHLLRSRVPSFRRFIRSYLPGDAKSIKGQND